MKLPIFIVIATVSSLFALSRVIAQDPSSPSAYSSNQIIVKYKSGQSPEELKPLVVIRQQEKQSFFGSLKILLEDIRYRLEGKQTPENKLSSIESVRQQGQVVKEEMVFENEQGKLGDYYLVTTDGSKDIQQVLEMYKKLPEVESVELNKIMRIMTTF